MADTKISPELAWSAQEASGQMGVVGSYPTLTNPNSVEVTYASSDADVATINAEGEITLVNAGATTISAIFEGNETYEAQVVTYVLIVKTASGAPVVYKLNPNGKVFPYMIYAVAIDKANEE